LKCWITQEIADAAMLRRVDQPQGRKLLGLKGSRDGAGIFIPYYWPGDPKPRSYRVRRDNPEWTTGKDGKPKPAKKYLGQPKAPNQLYIPPGVTPEQLQDLTIPIAIVEGEKRALALSRLASHAAERPRFIPAALASAWSWRGKVGKTSAPSGEEVELQGPIADLDRIAWNARTVFIVFDRTVHSDERVKQARNALARELTTRSAEVKLVNLPEDCGVNGIDDLLAIWGPDKVLELFDKSVSGARLQVVLPQQFQTRPEGMFRVTAKGEKLSETKLTNYSAAIITNIRLDDGIETKLEFEIVAELLGRTHRFAVPASEFVNMAWPIERMGAAAITYPNQREYARTAIQSLSMAAEDRCVYSHTGWRNVDGRWMFLHSGGAIGSSGAVSDVKVRLVDPVNRFELRLPAGPDKLVLALKASLRLVELGPAEICFPVLAATARSVFGDADFAIHVAGETGSFKSELAAVHQQHFGASMNRLHLPGAWSSTGNALETLAFHVKDALLVIDDFAPQGSANDVAKYHAATDRIFRAAGNRAGRGRLDSTATLREPKPPRALVLSTGEDLPRGHSVRARLLILELEKGAIKSSDLTECQNDARAGLYAEAMGGFVQWLAGRFEDRRAEFVQKVSDYRSRALRGIAHARTPEIAANLQAGFELYLDFGVHAGALNAAERDSLASRCWDALSEAAAAQAKYQAATEPTALFLVTLLSLLASGKAHLASRTGGEPDIEPGACGWTRDSGGLWVRRGDCIGWAEGDNIYLEPTAAHRAVHVAANAAGEGLPVTEQTLKKRLHEKGLLASVDAKRETLTIRKTVNGSSMPVLHLLRETVLPVGP
jgi:hypothetical protein